MASREQLAPYTRGNRGLFDGGLESLGEAYPRADGTLSDVLERAQLTEAHNELRVVDVGRVQVHVDVDVLAYCVCELSCGGRHQDSGGRSHSLDVGQRMRARMEHVSHRLQPRGFNRAKAQAA